MTPFPLLTVARLQAAVDILGNVKAELTDLAFEVNRLDARWQTVASVPSSVPEPLVEAAAGLRAELAGVRQTLRELHAALGLADTQLHG